MSALFWTGVALIALGVVGFIAAFASAFVAGDWNKGTSPLWTRIAAAASVVIFVAGVAAIVVAAVT